MARTAKKKTASSGMTQISLSLPKKLIDRIDELAAGDNRNRSNYIATYLERVAEEMEM